jgi:membrane protein
VKVIDRAVARFDRGIAAARRKSRLFDHVWLAKARYDDVLGGRLAAAISYYAFFAGFSLALLAYSVLGYVVHTENNGFLEQANDFLSANLPWINTTAIESGRSTVTVVSVVTLILTGIGWVESLRSAQRAVWHLDQHPGNMILRRLVDLGMLLGLGLLLALSLAMTAAIEEILAAVIGPDAGRVGGGVLTWSGPVLELLINLVLASALLGAVARLRLSAGRLLPVALVLAVGIQLLNVAGRYVIGRTERSPAYALVTGAVGFLVYLYLLNQLIVFASALAATSRRGVATDLGNWSKSEAIIGAPGSVRATEPE